MDGLHIQLLVGLDRDKAHRGPAHSFGDRCCVDEIALVSLHERLHILRRHETRFMPLFAKSLAEEMRAGASFHPNQINLDVRSEAKKLRARELFPHHHLSGVAQTNKMKNCLA